MTFVRLRPKMRGKGGPGKQQVLLGLVIRKRLPNPSPRACVANPKLTWRAYGREHASPELPPSWPMEPLALSLYF